MIIRLSDKARSVFSSQRKFITFLVIGFGSVAIDAGVYWLLTREAKLFYITGRIISLTLTLIWSYSANRLVTFKSKTAFLPSFLKYSVVNSASVLSNLGLMFVAVSLARLPDLASLIVISGGVSVFSYLSHKHWTFKDAASNS
jgi:putative flippase GtrA